MKRKLVTLICLFVCLNGTQAQSNATTTVTESQQSNWVIPESIATQTQNDTIMTVFQLQDCHGSLQVCSDKYSRILLYAEGNCNDFFWTIFGDMHYENPLILSYSTGNSFGVEYGGCNIGVSCLVQFIDPNVPTETTEELWIHGGELAELQAVEADSASMYDIKWNTGEEENIIYKPAGTYIAGISDMCATAYRTKIVKESVEIDLSTCDLESNLNMVTWPTTEAQAQYIDHVIVKRDGMQVGTADYSDGQFTDNIGSGAASRTYTLTAIATDGTECPIVSYPKETIHMSYTLGMNNTIEIEWNTPTGYDLLGYNICEWHEDDGSLTVIDYVGSSVTSYTCSQSQFDEGYIVVQGVEAGKNGETRLLSNRSLDLVGLGENEATAFRVYPNPTNGVLFVETRHGTSLPAETYRIVNPIGQTMMEGQITTEKQQIDVRDLPKGMYFITVGGATRKFVVE